jgi:serine/threonine-protein kinase
MDSELHQAAFVPSKADVGNASVAALEESSRMIDALLTTGNVIAGKYRVERVIGRGGMGIVVAAHHLALDERVAVKLLLPEGAKRSEFVKRFLREARAVIKIKSEHVARVMDFGTVDGTPAGLPFIVMEYLDGCDLEALMKERGVLPAHEAVDYVLQACAALAEAHAHGIVHRDLKPANLFLCTRPSSAPLVKVLDFGISKFASGPAFDAETTRAAVTMGTPRYMSPEQLRSARTVDGRSDVWSLGVVLFKLITGSLPFRGDGMPELIAAILNDEPRAFGALRPDVDPALAGVIARCLVKDREARIASVRDLAVALGPFAPPAIPGAHAFEAQGPLLCAPLGDPTYDVSTVETVSPASTTAKRSAAPRTYSGRRVFAVGFASAALMAALGFVGTRHLRSLESASGTVIPASRQVGASVGASSPTLASSVLPASTLSIRAPRGTAAAAEVAHDAAHTISTASTASAANAPSALGIAPSAATAPTAPTAAPRPSVAAAPKRDPWED